MIPNPYIQGNIPLQQQHVTQVNGKASVDQIRLAPNSSVLLMDTTAPIVWLCVSDGVGMVSAQGYDITPHVEKPPVDIETLETRLDRIEKILSEMENRDGKSNDAVSKQQYRRNDESSGKQNAKQ